MKRIIKIGMDVHSTNYTLCALECLFEEDDRILAELDVYPDYNNIIAFIKRLAEKYCLDPKSCDITCGYEAGCLGFSLYEQLRKSGVKCVILAPTTMSVQKGRRIKNDARDALMIAQCLANNTYHAVHVPTKDDLSVREYIRMRSDHNLALKKVKQQINAFCLRHGYKYAKTKWTLTHIQWLRRLDFGDSLLKEVLDEYLGTYERLSEKLRVFDARIEELASQERYKEDSGKLQCFSGIGTNIAMSVIVESWDFKRFKKASSYASFLGLVPGEHSSGDEINRVGITKAGNVNLRRLMVEAAQSICRGSVYHKSKELRTRQSGNDAAVIAYADKANERLRRRYYHYIRRGMKRNIAITAVARELSCFIWGMMTGNIYQEVSA